MIRIPYTVPHNHIVLIVKADTGVEYSVQVAGCACLHPAQEGFVIPAEIAIGLKPRIPDVFNRTAWYHGIYGIPVVPPEYKIRQARRLYKKYKGMFPFKDHHVAITGGCFQWAKENIERACKKIFKPSGFDTSYVVVDNITVVPHEQNYEAWMHCTFTLYGEPYEGVLTWENCD